MQAESGLQMMSMHACKKAYYAEAGDVNIHSFAFDALIAPVKQDLSGGPAVTNGLKSKSILDDSEDSGPEYLRNLSSHQWQAMER